MNCLKMNPEILIRRIDIKLRDTNYSFLNILNEYNIPSNIYYDYLSGLDEYWQISRASAPVARALVFVRSCSSCSD